MAVSDHETFLPALYAFVKEVDIHPPSRHSVGLPPALRDDGQSLSHCAGGIVTIHVNPSGCFLIGFAEDGRSLVILHQSIDEAREQAGR